MTHEPSYWNPGKNKSLWLSCTALVVLTGALTWYLVFDETELVLPDQKFEFQFGRGSGCHGLDLLRITSDGKGEYEYQTEPGAWRRKRFVVGEEQLAELRKTVDTIDVWGLRKVYHGDVEDGTQWCLIVRVDGKSKSVYCDNNFPDAIKQLADFVDRNILARFADPIAPTIVPFWQRRKHEMKLWENML